jgi:hypothetical protein
MGLKRHSHYFSGRNLISWVGEKYLGRGAHGARMGSYLCREVNGQVLFEPELVPGQRSFEPELGSTGNGTPKKLNLTEIADIDGCE